ncbi:hypothetical protein [Nocardia heshunensis]
MVSKNDNRTLLRGSLAAAALFAGLAVVKGAAVATPLTAASVAATTTATPGTSTGSGTGSATFWLTNLLHGCTGNMYWDPTYNACNMHGSGTG